MYLWRFNSFGRYSGKDITDVQEKLLNERVVGFVKKDETSMDELSDMISKLIKSS